MSCPTKPGLYWFKLQGSSVWRTDEVFQKSYLKGKYGKQLWCGINNCEGPIPVERRKAEWRGPMATPEESPEAGDNRDPEPSRPSVRKRKHEKPSLRRANRSRTTHG